MNADTKVPIRTTANGAFLAVPDADPEQVPDTFSISWQYDNFLMTFANGEVPRAAGRPRGLGRVLRRQPRLAAGEPQGCAVRPAVPRTIRKQGPPPPPTAGGVTLGAARRRRAARRCAGGGGPAAGAAGGARRRRGSNLPPVEHKVYVNPKGGVEEDYPLDAHTQNFLDCIKSRQKPSADMEIGYYAALPCLLALESMQQGKTLGWDAAARKSKAL